MGERQGLKYVWRTNPRAPAELFAQMASGASALHPALVQVLHARGVHSAELCLDFLAGISRDPDDPALLTDLPRAVERLVQARARQERVAIFTDYDADGVGSAAVLATGFRMIGIDPLVRLPNRFRDGYGLTVASVEELAEHGARVIVTADCGSTSHSAAVRARDLGVDLIITDHHQCPDPLPEAYALVNPWRPDCGYPFDHLCGAGVAFKLVQALADALLPEGRAVMEPLLDLVAVATVADIMPLVGENRRLVMAGLRIMNELPRPGVRALIEAAGLQPGRVDAASLGFQVAPRINAAGRLEDPSIALRLLMADSYEEAHDLATELTRLNQERQRLTKDLVARATEQVRPRIDADAYTLVCGGDGWAQGIVGLVAGRLAQEHTRPALVYSSRDGVATGSGRSIRGFDLLAALRACDDVFERYGGHHAAAGFTMPVERIPELQERFELFAREVITDDLRVPVLLLDGYLRPDTLTLDFAAAVERLAPFGAGFARPAFGMRDLVVVESRAVGSEGSHWRLRMRPRDASTYPFTAIAFGLGHLAERFPAGARLEAAFTVKRDVYQGNARVDVEVLDVAPGVG